MITAEYSQSLPFILVSLFFFCLVMSLTHAWLWLTSKLFKAELKVFTVHMLDKLLVILRNKLVLSSSIPLLTATDSSQEQPTPCLPQCSPSAPPRPSIQATSETPILTSEDPTPSGHLSHPPPTNLSTCYRERGVGADGGMHTCLNQQQGPTPLLLSQSTESSSKSSGARCFI